MNIHEYQAKELLAKFGVAVPRGGVAFTLDEVRTVANDLSGPVYVVKSQIHAGGRGAGRFKGNETGKGGVRVVESVADVAANAAEMLGNVLVTKQTGSDGKEVKRLYIEEGCNIARELYLSLLVDRTTSKITVIASTEGGMEIEKVATETPDKIITTVIDPVTGLQSHHARTIAFRLGLAGNQLGQIVEMLNSLYRAFCDLDASLVEVNPLVVTSEGEVIALDAKMNFDDNALFRHPELEQLRDEDEENPAEFKAAQHDLNYVKLDGSIGCMVNGAGLAMATMDIIKLYGEEPANFLDVGGSATRDRVKVAFKIILSDPNVKGILVNIFGGIMRCDLVAEGVVAAAREVSLNVPLVVRLEGTNVELGKQIMAKSGLPIVSAANLADAAAKIVRAVKVIV
ncbi:MAG: ADP-forming succinate--CoA ligase subunit beta [Rhodospirillaceae bacterium]|nr:ADP-forming succinate--CoA ligase subunit beta [Rhodospirillaceae bacterium]